MRNSLIILGLLFTTAATGFAQPQVHEIQRFAAFNVTSECAAQGNFVYEGGLRVWDVSDPAHPRQRGYLKTPIFLIGTSPPNKVLISGNYAYLYLRSNFAIVDVSDPDNPYTVFTRDLPAQSVSKDGDWLAISGNWTNRQGQTLQRFTLYDVSNPATPQLALQTDLPEGFKTTIKGDILYSMGDSLRVSRINTEGGVHLETVRSYPYPGEMWFWDRFAILRQGSSMIKLDVSDPGQIQQINRLELHTDPYVITWADNHRLYLLSRDSARSELMDVNNFTVERSPDFGFWDSPLIEFFDLFSDFALFSFKAVFSS